MNTTSSFFGDLLDTSFSHFVTLRLVKVLYILAMAVLAIGGVVFFISGLLAADSFFGGLSVLILTPIIGFAFWLAVRIWLEIVVVMFRIGETATEVRDLLASRPRD